MADPLVLAIYAAAIAAGGNAVVSFINGRMQQRLEERKQAAELELETSKAESARVLQVIQTGNTETAAANLRFLVESGLVRDPDLEQRLKEFLKDRPEGSGPALPAPSDHVSFEPTQSLSPDLQARLQSLLDEFISYLVKRGFPQSVGKVSVKIDKLQTPNAYYDGGSRQIVMDRSMAADSSVALREYSHHILMSAKKMQGISGHLAAIESGLADYFGCSFLDSPAVGVTAAKVYKLDTPFIRSLENDYTYADFNGMDKLQLSYKGAEIWGGAFWQIRGRIGRDLADTILGEAWRSTKKTAEAKTAATFVKSMLAAAGKQGSAQQVNRIRGILEDRGFPIG